MNDTPRPRLGVLGVVIVSLFAALFARLWYLQVMTASEARVTATALSRRDIVDPAPRGRILDREGRVLVDNRISIVVTVDRQKLPDLDEPRRAEVLDALALDLSRYTGTPFSRESVEKRLNDVRYSPYQPVPVADDVPKELEVYLAEHASEFDGAVDVRAATVRAYPYGRLAAHLFGYVGSINDTELESRTEHPKSYSLDDQIGKTGVEAEFEDELRGTPGLRVIEVDAQGNPVREISRRDAVPGNDVQLTIDADIQAVAERSLVDQLQRARDRRNRDGSFNRSPGGSSVVLDPTNGQVLAMASFPDFDPAEFTQPIPTQRWEELNAPEQSQPLTNRAIQGEYAPASTFKLITSLAGLNSGAITPDTSLDDQGFYRIPSCSGACFVYNSGRQAHGTVDLRRALTVSSDVYFYDMGARFWIARGQYGDPIQAVADQFGFGHPTAVQLPGERTGWVPNPDNKRQRHEDLPEVFPEGEWYTGDNVNLAIGQGDMLVTPLQLANAYAAFANGGTLYSPNLLLEVRRGTTTEVVRAGATRVLRQIPIAPEARAAIMDGLVGVTTAEDGTAVGAFSGFPTDRFPTAGKTGTGEVGPDAEGKARSDNALYAGIAPVADPRYVAVAILESSGFGAVAAAPVARQIFEVIADPAESVTVEAGGELSVPVPTVDNGDSAVLD
ncbi:MAG: penicillin-binding protein 2 [Acidimicrobiia bacterium]